MTRGWLVTAKFDIGWIFGPPLVAVALVLAIPSLRVPTDSIPAWGWVVFVLSIDVAHVWSSLYRTYADPVEFPRRRTLYTVVPIACLIGGIALYGIDALLFWRVLAYIAVFHFVRQQFGMMMLYKHRAGERGRIDAWIDRIAVYATMIYPLAFWHATPGRNFAWFMAGDFVSLPWAWIPAATRLAYAGAILAFAARQIQNRATGRPWNWGKIGIVLSTATTWYVGIVAFNSDFAFTLTNVVAHGVPYVGLVWIYSHRKWAGSRSWRGWLFSRSGVLLFAGILVGLAYVEEGLWDLLVWREHGPVFAGWTTRFGFEVPALALAVIVPLLSLPQVTHYVLDAFLWRFDGSNPGLRYYLFGEGPDPNSSAETPSRDRMTRELSALS